jgi:ankyrin repeat protein
MTTINIKLYKTQKTLLKTIALSFLYVFTFSLNAFASDNIDRDYSQSRLGALLYFGKEHCHIEKLKISRSNCFGLSVVWSYAKLSQITQPETKNWFDNTIQDVYTNWSNCDNIKKFEHLIGNIQELQMRDKYNIDGKELQQEYSIAASLDKNQLKTVLESIIQDLKPILITTLKHATALFKNGEMYYYYDSNSITGERATNSLNDVVNWIYSQSGDITNNESQIFSLHVLVFNKTENYQTQQEVLEKTQSKLTQEDGLSVFATAIKNGCLEGVQYFLNLANNDLVFNKIGNYPTQQEILEKTQSKLTLEDRLYVFTYAIRSGCLESVQYFLNKANKDKDIVWLSMFNGCPLNIAVVKSPKVALFLLDHGAHPATIDKNGKTALMHVFDQNPLNLNSQESLDLIKALIEKSSSIINKADNNGLTPLMLAAEKSPKVALFLLDHGACYGMRDKNGKAALMHVFDQNSSDLNSQESLDLIKALITAPDIFGYANNIIHKADNNGITPLMLAAEKSPKIALLLFDHDADLSTTDKDGKTALMHVFDQNPSDLNSQESLDLVKALIEKSPRIINKTDNIGRTPLMFAAETPKIALLLLDHGADPSATDKWEETALIFALIQRSSEILNSQELLDLVKALIEKSPNIINKPAIDTGTPLTLAKKYGAPKELIDLLEQHGAYA